MRASFWHHERSLLLWSVLRIVNKVVKLVRDKNLGVERKLYVARRVVDSPQLPSSQSWTPQNGDLAITQLVYSSALNSKATPYFWTSNWLQRETRRSNDGQHHRHHCYWSICWKSTAEDMRTVFWEYNNNINNKNINQCNLTTNKELQWASQCVNGRYRKKLKTKKEKKTLKLPAWTESTHHFNNIQSLEEESNGALKYLNPHGNCLLQHEELLCP